MALKRIALRDFVIVQQLELDLHTGFTVLTGETGAGKSIIIDAVNLIMGGRASAGLIRTGADEATVEAVFALPEGSPLGARLAEAGIECDGELHGDAALEPNIRNAYMADSTLTDSANLLICPNLDAANILFNVLKITGGNGLTIGPMLLGAAASAHILTPSSTMRRVLNQTALAVVNAQARRK